MRNLITAFILSFSLLTASRNGATTDEARMGSSGYDIAGLEQVWRQAIGPQSPVPSAQPSVHPTQSFALQGAVTPMPTPTIDRQSTQDSPPIRNTPPLSLTLTLLALCCALLLVIGVFVLGFVARNQSRKEGKNGK